MKFCLSILEQFEKQQGFKLMYTPFFAYAVVSTLKEFPLVNCSIDGAIGRQFLPRVKW
jgi:pyruvate/2-oxoglutarate dehydrogenase complex dihydrolipoamide acyltransferase (E2) component